MLKDIFSRWFRPQKEEQNKDAVIANLEHIIATLKERLDQAYSPAFLEDAMRKSLGLPMINLVDVDDDGRPPHYLNGLVEDARKQYVAEMEDVFQNEKFQTVWKYTIQLLGNHSMQKAPKEIMENGRIGIIALRTLYKEFENAHAEYIANHPKDEEDFDPTSLLPE